MLWRKSEFCGWGQDATLFPGWKRVREAAVNAATAPETWIPVVGALVLQVDDMDKEISEWAADTMPVFGSADDAGRASDRLSQIGHGLYLLTALSTPSGDEGKVWVNNKLKGIGIGPDDTTGSMYFNHLFPMGVEAILKSIELI